MRGGPFPREPVDILRTAIPEAILTHRTANKLQTHLCFMFFFHILGTVVIQGIILCVALGLIQTPQSGNASRPPEAPCDTRESSGLGELEVSLTFWKPPYSSCFSSHKKRKGLALQYTTFVVKMTTCSINHKEINFTEYFMLKFSILKKLSCSPESPNCYLLKGRLNHIYVSCNKSL